GPVEEGRRVLQPELVREGEASRRQGRLSRRGDSRLSGAAAGWHLGDGAVLPQRFGADSGRWAELEDAAEDLHTLLPHGQGRLRRGEPGMEGAGAGARPRREAAGAGAAQGV